MERLIAWLPQSNPAQRRTSIVHGDYKLDNVMFGASEPRLAAIIEGVVGRAREGAARDPQAAALADWPPLMAKAAGRIAQRAGA